MVAARPDILVTVLAHNEEARIAACLESLLAEDAAGRIVVVVNGSTDGTARIVRGFADRGVRLVEYAQGGKSRSWNRFMLDEAPEAEAYVFVDGDARVLPGSIAALANCLASRHGINAAAGMPRNGRRAGHYRRMLVEEGGIFGDLYALSGDFVARLRASGLRLPEDLVGDDSLIGALAHTDLEGDSNWDDARTVACLDAGFLCDPTSLSPSGLKLQARRMVNYSVRHFQNRIVSAIMGDRGPGGLPPRMADLYGEWLPRLKPRRSPTWFWFDIKALERMRAASEAPVRSVAGS